MQFIELYTKMSRPGKFRKDIRIIGIDPGQTTGVSVWEGTHLIRADQLHTKEMPDAAVHMEEFIALWNPTHIVMEAYRIYSWKTKQHAGSDVHTLRLIGAIQYIAHLRGIPVIFQGAGQGKGFCTDEKLKEWGFYQTAFRHANDAIRHVAHYLLFGRK